MGTGWQVNQTRLRYFNGFCALSVVLCLSCCVRAFSVGAEQKEGIPHAVDRADQRWCATARHALLGVREPSQACQGRVESEGTGILPCCLGHSRLRTPNDTGFCAGCLRCLATLLAVHNGGVHGGQCRCRLSDCFCSRFLERARPGIASNVPTKGCRLFRGAVYEAHI